MKNTYSKIFALMLCAFMLVSGLLAQDLNSSTFSGLKFRNLGPAFTSGRIADIAIDPNNENIWYVAVGSGGVWKTVNNATTWTPVFDSQPTYSIGCLTIDPNNSNTIWVGTGENVGGRHVAYGDGIYVSYDAGKSWKNMGLKKSEHISKIVVNPANSNEIWVASQGPLWSKGGERGVYKSTDGGKTWKRTLGNDEWTGATDLLIDPNNTKVLYAATWDRHRTVAAYMGGGPGSGIHKSVDGGETWTKLSSGLPGGNLGKIGMAMSHFDSQTIYAAIETIRTKGGVWMSTDGGNSWTKQSDAVSGGTGPHYYQELYASPHVDGRLYLMNNNSLISNDHGKTFYRMNERSKHGDSHSITFKMSNPDYVLFGTDGGIYESYDHTQTWRFIRNLPITQYYKVAVDDSEPFYKIYGGTQDNGSHGGPSRTTAQQGIRNGDWWKTLGADGHQSAVEPGNPNITYGEFQQGVLFRIDQTTGETVAIQPQPGEGEPYERFNWDAPILVSPHNPARIYFASQRVWKSDNRGDSWTAVSGDLTRNQERITLPIMGRTQSWDNAWDVGAMSNYNTITSLAESPKQEGLLYAGTDDGIIQISEDGGANWRKVELGGVKGVPATAFVNDVRADLFDANTVYAVLDNHKNGDYKPYVLKSTNKGRSWSLINGDLPADNLLTWRIVQDHIKKEVMFLAAEYGIYFTYNGGANWVKLTGGLPTISFRDITIQRREDDLVGASFGRGFYVLDDIAPLRNFNKISEANPVVTFRTKPALWYAQRSLVGSQGDTEYEADNPPYGAIFTYYLKESFNSIQQERKKREGELNKSNSNIPFPGWASLEAENRQEGPMIIITIKDADGNVVNQIKGGNKKGFNRVDWDLQHASRSGVTLQSASRGQNFFGRGPSVTPGTYTYTISKLEDGTITDLTEPQSFEVIRLFEGALEGASYAEINAFRVEFEEYSQKLTETNATLDKHLNKINAMKIALGRAPRPSNELYKQLEETRVSLLDIEKELSGDRTKGEIGERSNPTASDGMRAGFMALGGTYGPTPNHKKALDRASGQLEALNQKLDAIIATFEGLERSLEETGAPWVEK